MEQDRVDEATFGTSGVETTTTAIPPPSRSPSTAERFILAGIGAVATALDEAEGAYDRFVDRGRQARDEWQDRAVDVRAQRATARYRMREALRSTMDAVLDSVSVPSKSDVDTINVKLNILTRKIDDLQMEVGGDAAPTVASAPPPSPSDLAT